MPTAELARPRPRPAAAVPRGRTHLVGQMLSLMPLPVLAAVALGPDVVRRALLQPDPELLGFPTLAVLALFTLAWTLSGLLVLRHARSPLGQAVTLLLFTIPATLAAVVWPLVLVGHPPGA